jgi:HEPN domain-containing protein
MRRPLKEAHRWLLQGENDLRFAELAVREGFYAQACFICQQSGEKALKAVAYALGDRQVVGHSLFVLVEKLKGVYPDLASLSEDAGILDQYYIGTRYPNGIPDGVPFQVYTERQAREAVQIAERIVEEARRLVQAAESAG